MAVENINLLMVFKRCHRNLKVHSCIATTMASSVLLAFSGAPDLRISELEINRSSAPDVRFSPSERLRFDVTGLNNGAGTSKRNVKVNWYFGLEPGARTFNIGEGHFGRINGLAPGETERESKWFWKAPSRPGVYWITAVIDTDQKNREQNESNNYRTARFMIDPNRAPDLEISKLELVNESGSNGEFRPGEALRLTVEAENVGTRRSGRDVRIDAKWAMKYLGKPEAVYEKGFGKVNGLSEQETESDKTSLKAPTTPGTYHLVAQIDGKHQIRELNESNNLAVLEFRVVAIEGEFQAVKPQLTHFEKSADPTTNNRVEPADLQTAIKEALAKVAAANSNKVEAAKIPPAPPVIATALTEPLLHGESRFSAIGIMEGQLVFEWEGKGVLEMAPSLNGPWIPVEGASSPASVSLAHAHYFFRLREAPANP